MHTFTGKESWLNKPLEELTWDDLPDDRNRAIGILALRSMPYNEYLQTNHWRDVRKIAFKKYIGQCLCGQNARDVHHISYERKGFEGPEDVVALCRECHERWHATWKIRIGNELKGAN